MEAVEINAGGWYLRALRDDERISDVPALADLGITDPADYVVHAETGWADESVFIWAICIPTTGELAAVIGLVDGPSICGRARAGHDDALAAAVEPVRRFASGALGWSVSTALRDGIPAHPIP